MAQNVYEGLFLFDANRFARKRDAIPKSVEDRITSEGGDVLISRLWEERKLAYPIKGQRKGTYWLIYFRSDPGAIKQLNRQCEIDDNVLRHLAIKLHPHLVDAIIAHASDEGAPPVEVDAEGEATPKEAAAETETPKAETAKAETETAKAETVKAETVKAETVKAETVKAETVKAETAKAETAKVG